jgi:excisionase family DNA binding protein
MMPDDTNQTERILTLAQTAEMLRVHRSTVSRYAKSGELRSHKLGSRVLFRESDVWAFFDKQAVSDCVAGKEGS